MVSQMTLPPLEAFKHRLDPEHLGLLRDSSALVGDAEAMRRRMQEDGYLFLPGCLDREEVLDARRELCRRLAEMGHLAKGTDPMDAVSSGTWKYAFMPSLAKANPPLMKVLYQGKMMEIFRRFLGGDVRHFDFTWIRVVAPGKGTASHCDSVYMNRGTLNLYTAWTPIGDIPFEHGGLMVLEGSNNHKRLRETYCMGDVDSYCTNRSPIIGHDGKPRPKEGWLTKNPVQLRNSLGGRWLTSEYRAGDVLIFSIFTVHASIDNQSDRIRLSTDTRYQLASESADERWIGAAPGAHGTGSKRGRVC